MDLTALTDDEARDLLARVYADVQRRDAIANAPAQAEALAATYAAAIGRKDGDAWVQPTGAHDAYANGAIVTHSGQLWISIVPNNAHAPGVSGWRPHATGDDVAEFVKPSGAHDAYAAGARVRFEGKVWESKVDGNAYSPTEYPPNWLLIG